MLDKSNLCEKHIMKWYGFLGVTRKGWNFIAVLEVFFLAFNILWLIYKWLFTELEDPKFVLHFITLGYFYVGILWTIYSKKERIIKMAKDCDTFVGLTTQEDREEYIRIAQRLKHSKLYLGTNIMTAQVFNIATIIATRRLVMHFLFGSPRELMYGGTEESTPSFSIQYAVQSTFMVTASTCIAVNTQLLYRICYHLIVKYKLLSFRLSRLSFDKDQPPAEQETQLSNNIKNCVIHHQHLLKIFNEFKEICGTTFLFTYFGLFASIGLSRTALTGDHPDFYAFPDFMTESGYLFFQCYCLNDLIVENENVKRAIYENDWMWYPRSAIKSLIIIGLRTKTEPLVQLFPGGSPATVQTYGTLMNASMAYFMSALIF